MNKIVKDELGAPKIVDRSIFQAEVDTLRAQEKAHKCARGERDCGGSAAAPNGRGRWRDTAHQRTRRRGNTIETAFEGRRMLIAYYFMWHAGQNLPGAMRGMLVLYIAGPRAVLHSLPRRYLCHVLPRPV